MFWSFQYIWGKKFLFMKCLFLVKIVLTYAIEKDIMFFGVSLQILYGQK